MAFLYSTTSMPCSLKETMMGKPGRPRPVMLFVGMLSGEIPLMNEIRGPLEEVFGSVLDQSQDFAWGYTDYYREELGETIFRRFLFFENFIEPDLLARIKIQTNRLEERYMRQGAGRLLRRINLDPGYLDASKLVLASTKDYSHRIFLGLGVYAEVTLTFAHGSFHPLAHTYPDYRAEEVMEVFHRMRNVLMQRRKNNE